jgi:hypothetical protein
MLTYDRVHYPNLLRELVGRALTGPYYGVRKARYRLGLQSLPQTVPSRLTTHPTDCIVAVERGFDTPSQYVLGSSDNVLVVEEPRRKRLWIISYGYLLIEHSIS